MGQHLTYDKRKLHCVSKAVVSSQMCYPDMVSSSRGSLLGSVPLMDSSTMMSFIPHSSCDSCASLAFVNTVGLLPKAELTDENRHLRSHVRSILAFSVTAFLMLLRQHCWPLCIAIHYQQHMSLVWFLKRKNIFVFQRTDYIIQPCWLCWIAD